MTRFTMMFSLFNTFNNPVLLEMFLQIFILIYQTLQMNCVDALLIIVNKSTDVYFSSVGLSK